MPRKLLHDQRRIEIRVPEPLALKVELFLPHDPRTGKVAYGEWSNLAERLFNQFLNEKAGV